MVIQPPHCKTLTWNLYQMALKRFNDIDIGIINQLLAAHYRTLPLKVNFIEHHVPFTCHLDHYLYFVQVYNAGVFIRGKRAGLNRSRNKEFKPTLRKLYGVVDMGQHHLATLSAHFDRSFERDFYQG